MDDREYQHLADDVMKKIETMFEDVDADDLDLERAGDVITMTARDGKKCVVNTQRPTRQIWVAANARAWHFSFDGDAHRWKSDKNADEELFETVATLAKTIAGVDAKNPFEKR